MEGVVDGAATSLAICLGYAQLTNTGALVRTG
jgi:hypothetical protein